MLLKLFCLVSEIKKGQKSKTKEKILQKKKDKVVKNYAH